MYGKTVISAVNNQDPCGVPLSMPLGFFNRGCGEGIVSEIELIVRLDQTAKVYWATFEVDLTVYMRGVGGGRISADSVAGRGPSPIILKSNEVDHRAIVFFRNIDEARDTKEPWQSGDYTFDLLVRVEGAKNFKRYHTFSIFVPADMLNHYLAGQVYEVADRR